MRMIEKYVFFSSNILSYPQLGKGPLFSRLNDYNLNLSTYI